MNLILRATLVHTVVRLCLLTSASWLLMQLIGLAQEHQGCYIVSPSGELRSLDHLCGHSTMQDREQQAQSFFDRGSVLKQSEQYEDAIQAFDEAINIRPDYEEAYAGRAISNAAIGNFSAAIADYEHVADIARNTGNTEHAKQVEEAINRYRNID